MSEELSPDDQLKYFRMYRTILQMLDDRGYELDGEKRDMLDPEYSLDDYQTIYGAVSPAQLNGIFESRDPDNNDRVQIRFDINEAKINNKFWTSIIDKMKQDNINHAILIVRDGSIPKNINRSIDLLRERGQRVEFFEQKEVIINITQHELVPKHQPLTAEQKKALLDRYHINDSQLPKILKTDPVARYYGVSPGTVIKITRKSETAGRYVTYRLVC